MNRLACGGLAPPLVESNRGRGAAPEERVRASFEADTQSLVVTANSEHHEDIRRLLAVHDGDRL